MKSTLFIVSGQIGAGKTTVAQKIHDILNIPVVSVDETIKKLFSRPSNEGKDVPFNNTELDVCYKTFAMLAEILLSNNTSLIVDGAFAKKEQRNLLVDVAGKIGAACTILHVTCPDEIIKERITKRYAEGNGVGWDAHKKLKATYEPLIRDHYTVDSSQEIEGQLREFLEY